MVLKFFAKKSALLADKSASSGAIKSKITLNRELAKKLHEPIIKRFEKRKVYPSIKGNIWGADLADTLLISKPNKGIRFLYMCY